MMAGDGDTAVDSGSFFSFNFLELLIKELQIFMEFSYLSCFSFLVFKFEKCWACDLIRLLLLAVEQGTNIRGIFDFISCS